MYNFLGYNLRYCQSILLSDLSNEEVKQLLKIIKSIFRLWRIKIFEKL